MFGLFNRKSATDPRGRREVQLKERGNRFLAEGQLQKAEACYRQAVAANGDFAAGYLNLGFVLSEQGRRDEAEHALGRAVALDPAQADAWYLLGKLAHARGGREAALERLRRSLEADPRLDPARRHMAQVLTENGQREEAKQVLAEGIAIDQGCANLNLVLGNLLAQEGAWDEAADRFRKELAIQPELAEAHLRLGEVLRRKGALADAVASYRAALATAPDRADAHLGLAEAYSAQGEFASAIQCYSSAIEAAPESAAAHKGLAAALLEQGDIDAAIASYHAALAQKPEDATVHCDLGGALHLRGEHDRAVEQFRRALALRPDYAAAHHNMGSVLLKRGNVDAAIACYRETLRIDPESIDAHLNLGIANHTLGNLDAATANFRRAMAIAPESASARHAHSNLLLALSASGDDGAGAYLLEARRYGEKALTQARPYRHSPAVPSARPLRVGFVSGDLRTHPVGFFLENVLAHLASPRLSLVAYSTYRVEDELTARLKPRFSEWSVVARLSDEAAAARIHDDRIDVLVDLAGHTAYNRLALFAWKPAPVQASWLGYWASTGVPGIDYVIADPVSVPAERAADFTESVWRLPQTRLCFTPPEGRAGLAVTPPPALRNGWITFACFQNLAKITDAALALWARVLCALPDARLRLQDRHLGYPGAREELRRRLAQAGIAPDRVTMHGRSPREDYLAAHAEVDIILDTLPFSGGTTTCEALWMGVPTLTLCGRTLVSRQGASLLTCVGLENWIARDEDEYVAMALRHATDTGGLAVLRSELRERSLASPLFDAERFARRLEEALYEMWRQRVGRAPG